MILAAEEVRRMKEAGSDAGLSSSVSHFPFHTWCFNATFTLPKVLPAALLLLFFFPRHSACVFSRTAWLFASLMFILSFATFCYLDASYEQLTTSCWPNWWTCCPHTQWNAYVYYHTVISYNILVCFYLGTRKANINYILINAFVIYGCQKPLFFTTAGLWKGEKY